MAACSGGSCLQGCHRYLATAVGLTFQIERTFQNELLFVISTIFCEIPLITLKISKLHLWCLHFQRYAILKETSNVS